MTKEKKKQEQEQEPMEATLNKEEMKAEDGDASELLNPPK